MSDFEMDSDGTYQWVIKGGETLFADDCAATMNQQAETIQQLKARIARLETAIKEARNCIAEAKSDFILLEVLAETSQRG